MLCQTFSIQSASYLNVDERLKIDSETESQRQSLRERGV